MGGNLLGRPRAGGGPPARADRRDRRRGRADGAVRLARARTSCCSRRAAPRPRFEDDGPTGAALLHDALRRLRAPARRQPAAEPVGPHRAARRRPLLLAHRRRCRGWPTWPASSSAPASNLNVVAPEQAAARAARPRDRRRRRASPLATAAGVLAERRWGDGARRLSARAARPAALRRAAVRHVLRDRAAAPRRRRSASGLVLGLRRARDRRGRRLARRPRACCTPRGPSSGRDRRRLGARQHRLLRRPAQRGAARPRRDRPRDRVGHPRQRADVLRGRVRRRRRASGRARARAAARSGSGPSSPATRRCSRCSPGWWRRTRWRPTCSCRSRAPGPTRCCRSPSSSSASRWAARPRRASSRSRRR